MKCQQVQLVIIVVSISEFLRCYTIYSCEVWTDFVAIIRCAADSSTLSQAQEAARCWCDAAETVWPNSLAVAQGGCFSIVSHVELQLLRTVQSAVALVNW